VLLLVEHGQRVTLTCFSLIDSVPSFEHDMTGQAEQIIEQPLLGPGFVVIPGQRAHDARLVLHVLNLETRSGALPDGAARLPPISQHSPYRVTAVPPYIAVQTGQGITIYGSSAK
jgi:hypothetical protein